MPETSTPVEHWVVSPDGVVGTVPADQVERASKEGYRSATVDEQVKAESARGADSPVAAAALGALSIIPGAQSAIARVAGGPGNAQLAARGVRQIRQESPNAALAGQFAGAIGLGALGGPTSLAGAAGLGGALSGASSAEESALAQQDETGKVDLGQVAKEGLTGAAIGAGTGGLLGAAAGRVLPRALANSGPIAGAAKVLGLQAAGGAVAGTVSQAAEDLISDKELTAEQLMAAAGRGALFGLGTGIAPAMSIARALRAQVSRSADTGGGVPQLSSPTGEPTAEGAHPYDVRAGRGDYGGLNDLQPGLADAAKGAQKASGAFDAAAEALGSKEAVASVMAEAGAAADAATAEAPQTTLARSKTLGDRAADLVIGRAAKGDAGIERTLRRVWEEGQRTSAQHNDELNAATSKLGGTVQDVLDAGTELNRAERHAATEDAMRELVGDDPEKLKVAMRAAEEQRRTREGGPLSAAVEPEADRMAREAAAGVRDVAQAEQTVRELANGLGKAKQMADLVPEAGQEGSAGPMIREGASEAIRQVKEFAELHKKTQGVSTQIGKLAKQVDRLEVVLTKSKPSNRDTFMLLDDLKRNVDALADFGGEGPRGTSDQNAAIDGAKQLRRGLKNFLQDESLFGKAATAQKAINEPLSEKIGLGQQFKDQFTTRYGEQHGKPVIEGNARAFKNYFENPLGAESDITARGLSDFARSTREYYDAVETHYRLSAGEKAEVAKARKALDTFERLTAEAKTRAQAKAVVDRIDKTPMPEEQHRDNLTRRLGQRGTFADEANPEAIKSMLSGILEPGAEAKQRALTDYAPALTDQILRLEKRGGLNDQQKSAIAKARKAVRDVEPTLTKAVDDAKHVASVKAIAAEQQGHGSGIVTGLLAGAAGHAVAGPFGIGAGLAGLIAHGSSRPLAALAKIAEVQRTANSVKTSIRGAAARVAGIDPAKLAAHEGDIHARGPGIKEPPRMSDAEVVKAINDLRSETPEARQARAAKLGEDLKAHAPKLAMVMAITSSNALNYIASTLPQPMTSGLAYQPLLDKPRYSKVQIDATRDKIETVVHPMGAVNKIAEGRLSQASAECLKVVYPLMFKELQRSISVALTMRKDSLGWHQAKAISKLFDIPASAALEPSFVSAMQDSKAPATQQPSDQGGAQAAPHQALSKLTAQQPEMRTGSEQIAMAR